MRYKGATGNYPSTIIMMRINYNNHQRCCGSETRSHDHAVMVDTGQSGSLSNHKESWTQYEWLYNTQPIVVCISNRMPSHGSHKSYMSIIYSPQCASPHTYEHISVWVTFTKNNQTNNITAFHTTVSYSDNYAVLINYTQSTLDISIWQVRWIIKKNVTESFIPDGITNPFIQISHHTNKITQIQYKMRQHI